MSDLDTRHFISDEGEHDLEEFTLPEGSIFSAKNVNTFEEMRLRYEQRVAAERNLGATSLGQSGIDTPRSV